MHFGPLCYEAHKPTVFILSLISGQIFVLSCTNLSGPAEVMKSIFIMNFVLIILIIMIMHCLCKDIIWVLGILCDNDCIIKRNTDNWWNMVCVVRKSMAAASHREEEITLTLCNVNTFHLICCCMWAELTCFPLCVLFSGSLHFHPLLALWYWHQYWLHVCYTPQTQGRGPRVSLECKWSPCGQCHSLHVHWTERHPSPWKWKQIRNLCFYISPWIRCHIGNIAHVQWKKSENRGRDCGCFRSRDIYAIKKISPTLLCLLPFLSFPFSMALHFFFLHSPAVLREN